MKEKAVFIILDQFADWEYGPLAAELAQPEADHPAYEVVFASTTRDKCHSIGSLQVLPHLTLEQIPRDAAALILVGGNSWRQEEAAPVAAIAKEFLDAGKVVGAICDAARFLGAHGVLNAHRHTMNFAHEVQEEPLYTNPAGFSAQDAVRDRSLVTANGNAPYLFAREVLLALGTAEAEADKWHDFFKLGLRAAIAKHYPQA